MFKPRYEDHAEAGGGGGAAPSLSHAQIVGAAPSHHAKLGFFPAGSQPMLPVFGRAEPPADPWDRFWAAAVPDLAVDIGSRQWLRGLGTLLGLVAITLAALPDYTVRDRIPPAPIDGDAADEYRSQAILPLALGGDTGRRMGMTDRVQPLATAPERPRIELTATLAPGDGFARALRRAGVGETDAAAAQALVARSVAPGAIAPGTRLSIALGRRPAPGRPRLLERLEFRARFDLALAIERGAGGALALERRPIRVDTTPLRIRGQVGAGLYRSARAAGAPAAAVQRYLRTLADQTDLDSAIGPGDTFDMVLEYRRSAAGETDLGRLLYAGVERGGRPRMQLLRWGADGRFYEASGVGQQREGLVAPVPGPVISRFGRRRHPILGYTRMHSGIDFRSAWGTPIHAVTDGVVQSAGRRGGYGNFVQLSHGGGLGSGYGHMSRIAVSPGQRVSRGQVIGYVGSTGLSTGPHLHYELYRGGRKVDPMGVHFVTRAQLEGAELAAFRARLAAIRAIGPGAALERLAPAPVAAAKSSREIDRVDVLPSI